MKVSREFCQFAGLARARAFRCITSSCSRFFLWLLKVKELMPIIVRTFRCGSKQGYVWPSGKYVQGKTSWPCLISVLESGVGSHFSEFQDVWALVLSYVTKTYLEDFFFMITVTSAAHVLKIHALSTNPSYLHFRVDGSVTLLTGPQVTYLPLPQSYCETWCGCCILPFKNNSPTERDVACRMLAQCRSVGRGGRR